MDMSGVVETTLEALDGDLGGSNLRMTLEDVLAMDHLARTRAAEAAKRTGTPT